jgi:hypothetical protein
MYLGVGALALAAASVYLAAGRRIPGLRHREAVLDGDPVERSDNAVQ